MKQNVGGGETFEARIGDTADYRREGAAPGGEQTQGPLFGPPLPRQIQQDRCTMNEPKIYTANKQEIMDGFKYLQGMQASG